MAVIALAATTCRARRSAQWQLGVIAWIASSTSSSLEAILNGLLLAGLLALLALGLNLIFGVIDVVWICYAELVMVGMYGITTPTRAACRSCWRPCLASCWWRWPGRCCTSW